MRIHPFLRPTVAASVLCFLVSGVAAAENWPQWRGPNLDGISKETGLPTEWSETKNIAWTLKLPGKGGSTPAIWEDRIFFTSADGLVPLVASAEADRPLDGLGLRLARGKAGIVHGPRGGRAFTVRTDSSQPRLPFPKASAQSPS